MEFEGYLRFALALIFVLGLIGVLSVVARRYGLGLRSPQRQKSTRRLSIAEIMPLDAKRRAVLIRRDEVEHLIVLGPHGETVIETGIPATSTFSDALQAAQRPDSSTLKVVQRSDSEDMP